MRNKLGSAINRRLSGVRLTAEDEQALLAGVMERKDEIVKKKLSAAMVAAAVLVFLVITCAFAAEMKTTPQSTPLAAVTPTPEAFVTPRPTPTSEVFVTPRPTPTPEAGEWNSFATDGVVNMQMKYVIIEGTCVTMEVCLTPAQSELVCLALNAPDTGVDRYPGLWNLVIDRNELSLILPEELDSGMRRTQVALEKDGLTFTLFGQLKEETVDPVRVTAATGKNCPPLSVSVNCVPCEAKTAEIFSGAYDVHGATVNRIQCTTGDGFAYVTIDYTAMPDTVYAAQYGNYMHREPHCNGLQDAVRYDDPQDDSLAERKPCPVCWYDAADMDTLFEDVYTLLNPGVDVPADNHPNPISDFTYHITDDGSRVTYYFSNIESYPYGLPGDALQVAHADEDPQILFTLFSES